jgi:hypothetical protein
MEQEKIESALGDIASDLGFGSGDDAPLDDTAPPVDDTAPPSDETAPLNTGDDAPPADETAPAPPTVRAAPKAWAKEQHERFAKLDKETQDYIEHREKQMLEGLSQYSEKAKSAQTWEAAVQPYLPLIQAQGAKPHEAVTYLFEAHRQLSSGTPDQRAAYLVKVAESYGIDISKATASAATAAAEPPAVKELRERTERLERERQQELDQRTTETKNRVASEVTAFADAKDEKGNPKHPHFDECAEDIVALIHAGHTLDKAYEKAVYANPVTRAKELDRVRKADEEALRAKAKQEAEKARNASRTNVNSRDTRRTPTAPTAKGWEDTLEATMQEIKNRAH